MKCFNCGFDNPSEEKVCANCGANIEGGAPIIPDHSLLQGKYRILNTIGHGGMGNVYQAKDTETEQIVAIKEMLDYFRSADERIEAIQRFNQEADILASLDHPNILKVFDKFTDSNKHYFVMEYLDGENLAEVLAKARAPLPEELVLDIAKQICRALDYLHSFTPQIIYRDLKPANIIRLKTNQIKLIDFGVARFFNPIVSVTSIGTIGYTPREQMMGHAEPKSDIYALGATLHHLLTNQEPIPFTFPPIEKINPNFAKVIEKALADDVKQRYSAREMLSDLEHLLDPNFRIQGYTPQFILPTVKVSSVLAVDVKSIDFGTVQQKRGTVTKTFHITNPAYSRKGGNIPSTTARTVDYSTARIDTIGENVFTTLTGSSIRGDLLKGIIETNRSWIKVEPTYFAIEEAEIISVTVDVSQLTNGQYSGAVVVTSNGGMETIVILVNVEAPVLKVNPREFNIGDVNPGQIKEVSTFLVNGNPKSGNLQGTITVNQPWISTNIQRFNFPNDQVLRFQISTANLEHGQDFSASITIDSNGGKTNIPVSIHILAPVLDIAETKLDYGELIRKQRKILSFVLKNTGDGILQGRIHTSQSWMRIHPVEFQISTAYAIQCMVDTTQCKKSKELQKYQGRIFISSNDGSRDIDVEFEVLPETFFKTIWYAIVAWWKNRNVMFR